MSETDERTAMEIVDIIGDCPTPLHWEQHKRWLRQRVATALREVREPAAERIAQLEKALMEVACLTDFPDLHAGDMRKGLHCGVEDLDLRDRYQGADYGFEDATERCAEWAKNIARSVGIEAPAPEEGQQRK